MSHYKRPSQAGRLEQIENRPVPRDGPKQRKLVAVVDAEQGSLHEVHDLAGLRHWVMQVKDPVIVFAAVEFDADGAAKVVGQMQFTEATIVPEQPDSLKEEPNAV